MKLFENISRSAVATTFILLLMLVGYKTSSWAATGPGPGPAIYNAALNNPNNPRDTIDAQLKRLSAEAWIMIDADTKRILSSKNPDKVLYPASMTKMMTCILAIESGYLNETVTISREAASTSYGYVKKGEKYKLHDLLYRVMLPSDNGAAHAVGEFLSSKDTVSFATMMNNKAKSLKMTNTHFVNAHGLPDDNHYTTARDMMKLLNYCMKNKTFTQIVSKRNYSISTLAGTRYNLKSTNRLFDKYEGCIGVKTGTTRAAGGCLASAVVRDGKRIYLVIMKCEPARERTDESIVLYNKGFDMIKKAGSTRRASTNNGNKRNRSNDNNSYYDDNGRDVRDVPSVKRPRNNGRTNSIDEQNAPARNHLMNLNHDL